MHPDVDVAHQDRLAHVLHEAAQRHVERVKQLLDGPNVLLVIQNCGGRKDLKPHPKAATTKLETFVGGESVTGCTRPPKQPRMTV